MKKTLLIAFLSVTFNSFSQLTITTKDYSVNDIVTKILLDSTENLNVKNIKYTGSPVSIGVFDCYLEHNKFIKKGIILSTGAVADAKGPNMAGNQSSATTIAGDTDLEYLARGKTFDAAILEFDFTATGDSLSFNFFFASEEYPEYVGQGVNDVFGFFVTDLQTGGTRNIAYLPGSSTPITVDNVNAQRNSSYYIPNLPIYARKTSEWQEYKAEAERAYFFEFDGFTRQIRVAMPTRKGHEYHIKIAIADVGDRIYDSAIFLEANSFKTIPVSENAIALVKELFDIKDKNADSVTVSINIHFGVDSANIKDAESFAQLDKICALLQNSPKLKLEVNGHTDDSGKPEHNLKLSVARAKSVADYIQAKGIALERITYHGFGSSKPVSATDKSKNRRVDFIFR